MDADFTLATGDDRESRLLLGTDFSLLDFDLSVADMTRGFASFPMLDVEAADPVLEAEGERSCLGGVNSDIADPWRELAIVSATLGDPEGK